jgi:hypothetical protein
MSHMMDSQPSSVNPRVWVERDGSVRMLNADSRLDVMRLVIDCPIDDRTDDLRLGLFRGRRFRTMIGRPFSMDGLELLGLRWLRHWSS